MDDIPIVIDRHINNKDINMSMDINNAKESNMQRQHDRQSNHDNTSKIPLSLKSIADNRENNGLPRDRDISMASVIKSDMNDGTTACEAASSIGTFNDDTVNVQETDEFVDDETYGSIESFVDTSTGMVPDDDGVRILCIKCTSNNAYTNQLLRHYYRPLKPLNSIMHDDSCENSADYSINSMQS